jgi:hypothetical protein
MGNLWTLVFNQFLAYAEKNPQVIQDLIGELITAGLTALKTANTPKA